MPNTKLIIASNGIRTLAMLDGKVIDCESLDLHAEYSNVILTTIKQDLTHGQHGEAFFFDTLENMLGYKLRNQ